jgi:hypothetical protein
VQRTVPSVGITVAAKSEQCQRGRVATSAVGFTDVGPLALAPSIVACLEGVRLGGPGQSPNRPTVHAG